MKDRERGDILMNNKIQNLERIQQTSNIKYITTKYGDDDMLQVSGKLSEIDSEVFPLIFQSGFSIATSTFPLMRIIQ